MDTDRGGETMIEKIRNILSGGKTYLVCLSAILVAVIAFINGELEVGQLITAIYAAITGMTLRAGIAKNNSE